MKKLLKYIFGIAAMMTLASGLQSCKSDEDDLFSEVFPSGDMEICIGETVDMNELMFGDKNVVPAIFSGLSVYSTDENIVSIRNTFGEIYLQGETMGECDIVFTKEDDGSQSEVMRLKVKVKAQETRQLDCVMNMGKTYKLKSLIEEGSVESYNIENPDILKAEYSFSVGDDVITPLKEGTTKIFLLAEKSYNDYIYYEINVTVIGRVANEVEKTIKVGEELSLVKFASESYYNTVSNVSTSDSSVALITDDSSVVGLKAGEATITFTIDGQSGSEDYSLHLKVTDLDDSECSRFRISVKAGSSEDLSNLMNSSYNYLFYLTKNSNPEVLGITEAQDHKNVILKGLKVGTSTIEFLTHYIWSSDSWHAHRALVKVFEGENSDKSSYTDVSTGYSSSLTYVFSEVEASTIRDVVSIDPEVAVVSDNKIKGVSEGITVIYFTAASYFDNTPKRYEVRVRVR